jgi:hypothetical protein
MRGKYLSTIRGGGYYFGERGVVFGLVSKLLPWFLKSVQDYKYQNCWLQDKVAVEEMGRYLLTVRKVF